MHRNVFCLTTHNWIFEILIGLVLSYKIGIGSSYITWMYSIVCFIQIFWVQHVAPVIYYVFAMVNIMKIYYFLTNIPNNHLRRKLLHFLFFCNQWFFPNQHLCMKPMSTCFLLDIIVKILLFFEYIWISFSLLKYVFMLEFFEILQLFQLPT